MKRLFNLMIATCMVAATATFVACSDSDSDGNVVMFNPTMTDDEGVDVLVDYAEDVVIARYESLADAAKALYEAVDALSATSGSSDIATAADAWIDARQAWERTEAYLFGPVDMYKIDPGIDSWPLDLANIATYITNSSLTFANVRNFTGDYKGFHAIEFLLFEDGDSKTTLSQFNNTDGIYGDASFTSVTATDAARYLKLLTTELYYNTVLLVAEWTDVDNDAVADFETLTGQSIYTNNGGGYFDDFTAAGEEDSSYTTVSDALSVILESAAGIADEVGAVKIYDPYDSGDVLDVESWFSWNSVIDFTNNILGIKEAYYGKLCTYTALTINGTTVSKTYESWSATVASNSISAYVASGSTSLDDAVKEAIEDALDAVSSLPYPYRNNLTATAEITAAMDACAALVEALETAQMAVNDGYYIE